MRDARLETVYGKTSLTIKEDANFVEINPDEKVFGIFDGHGGKIIH